MRFGLSLDCLVNQKFYVFVTFTTYPQPVIFKIPNDIVVYRIGTEEAAQTCYYSY